MANKPQSRIGVSGKEKSLLSSKRNVGELKTEKPDERPFTKVNFWMMGGCLALIVIGFMLMSGGGSGNPDVFNPDMFSTRRIVVGPLLSFLGFLFMAFAIIWSPRKKKTNTPDEAREAQK